MSTPRTRESLDRIAGSLATSGAILGIFAGLLDVVAGPSIRAWVGNKLDTSTLGAGTVALSLIALAAAISWRRGRTQDNDRRLPVVLGLAVPAAICFTTIGRLWYLPGILLLSAAAMILMTSTRAELARAVDERRWLRGLVILLGAFYIFLGADAHGLPGALGIAGGLLVWWALAYGPGSRRGTLLLIALGALPFAIATWWSVVTPLIALLMLAIGAAAGRAKQRGSSHRSVMLQRQGMVGTHRVWPASASEGAHPDRPGRRPRHATLRATDVA